MALNWSNLPEDAVASVRAEVEALSTARQSPQLGGGTKALAAGRALTGLSQAYPLYAMPLAVVASTNPEGALKHAEILGWRSNVVDGEGAALVDYFKDGEGVAGVVRGPSAQRLHDAGKRAEKEAPADQDFEPRILTFGTLGMTELWLHSQTGQDRFYSLTDDAPRPRSAEDVFKKASGLASQQPVYESGTAEDNELGG